MALSVVFGGRPLFFFGGSDDWTPAEPIRAWTRLVLLSALALAAADVFAVILPTRVPLVPLMLGVDAVAARARLRVLKAGGGASRLGEGEGRSGRKSCKADGPGEKTNGDAVVFIGVEGRMTREASSGV